MKLYRVKGSFDQSVDTFYFVSENLATLEKMINEKLKPYEIISIYCLQETVFVQGEK